MTGTMRAVVLRRPGELAVMDVPIPELLPGQQLVRVSACGICGSDLRYLAGENPWARHTLGIDKPNPPDMVLGHEIGGEATVNGARARVACLAFRACGLCEDCRRGDEHLCAHTAHLGHGAGWGGQNPGGMAEYCPVWAEHLYPLPDSISAEQATFLDGLAVAVHAVRQAEIFPASRVLVLGAGPIGLMIAQVARALGSGPVTVADIYDAPLACARQVDIAAALDARGLGVQETCEAVLAEDTRRPAAVFDTTRDAGAQQAGLSLLARGGTLCLMGGMAPGLEIGEDALAGERRIGTCSNHRYEDFGIALGLLAERRVIVAPMITHVFALEDAVEAFAVANDKVRSGGLKVILKP
jgi:threonine dehydrogenase-like Zn-dependent dehydrogenase